MSERAIIKMGENVPTELIWRSCSDGIVVTAGCDIETTRDESGVTLRAGPYILVGCSKSEPHFTLTVGHPASFIAGDTVV